MTSDASDLAAARTGDSEAFARLFQRHAAVVLSLCRRGSTLADAEDAMQETFIRAYRRLDQLRGPDGFRPWLYTIAGNVCAERRRSAVRRNHHESHAAALRVNGRSTPPTSADAAEHAEQLDRLTAALDHLPDDERLAVHLYYIDPDPVAAAASALNLSRSGYYKLLHRARHRLAGMMREQQPV